MLFFPDQQLFDQEELSDEVLEFLNVNGYFNIKTEMVDGVRVWAANYKLMFTTAICYGLNETGYERRYCFDDNQLAVTELERWVNDHRLSDEHEPVGFIAKR